MLRACANLPKDKQTSLFDFLRPFEFCSLNFVLSALKFARGELNDSMIHSEQSTKDQVQSSIQIAFGKFESQVFR